MDGETQTVGLHSDDEDLVCAALCWLTIWSKIVLKFGHFWHYMCTDNRHIAKEPHESLSRLNVTARPHQIHAIHSSVTWIPLQLLWLKLSCFKGFWWSCWVIADTPTVSVSVCLAVRLSCRQQGLSVGEKPANNSSPHHLHLSALASPTLTLSFTYSLIICY